MLKDKQVTSKVAATKMGITPVKKRLMDNQIQMAIDKSTIEDAVFQHSIFCHTFFPYRNLGDVREWRQEQGNIKLIVSGGNFLNAEDTFEYAGIPYGTKSRLIMMYLNTNAVQNQSHIIDIGKTMSGFIKDLGLTVQGNTIREVKEQLIRVASAKIDLAGVETISDITHRVHVKLEIIRRVDDWFSKDDKQAFVWDTSVELSKDYFESLMKHAIPLDKRAIGALSHNAMALDIYAWLAQRLHRVDPTKSQFISWQSLKDQFGQGYTKMNDFKKAFRRSLMLAKVEYMSGRFEEDLNKGFYFHHSPSPIPPKVFSIPKLILDK
jgi:Plasmid encoded RepA protein